MVNHVNGLRPGRWRVPVSAYPHLLKLADWFGAHRADQRDAHERDRARQRIVIALVIGLLAAAHVLMADQLSTIERAMPWMCLAYAASALWHLKRVLVADRAGVLLQYLFVALDSVLTVLALACVPTMLATLYPVLMVQIVRCGMRYGQRTMWLAWGSAALAALVLLPQSAFWMDNSLLLRSFVVMLLVTPPLMGPLVRRLQSATDELRAAAGSDALTGLANRRTLDDRIRLAQELSARDHTMLALVLIDLDNFKTVNDTLGHARGDALLQQVADSLRGVTRAGDLVARLGGDEFVLLVDGLPTSIGVARAHEMADGAVARIRAAADAVVPGLGVAASAGICCWSHDRDAPCDAAELMTRADAAMYAAKRAGKSRSAMAMARSA